jgi:small-conductance mechanosensitive channel
MSSRTPVLRLIFVATATALAVAMPVHAEEDSPLAKEEVELHFLYLQQIRDPENKDLAKRIAEERESVRALVQDELISSLNLLKESDKIPSPDLPSILDQQRSIVTSLEERVKARAVDLELLLSEEEKMRSGTGTDAATLDALAGTLVRKAITEERITAMTNLLFMEQERLKKLVWQQRFEQFALLIQIGMYVGMILIVILIERAIHGVFLTRVHDPSKRYFVSKIFTYGVYSVLTIVVLVLIFSEHQGILASLAIVGAGIAVALHDLIKDFIGWIIIAHRRIFAIGHRITIGQHTGEVIDVGGLRFTILEAGSGSTGVEGATEHTGKVVSIPNSRVLLEPVVNHSSTSEYTKAEMRITISFESDRIRAEAILLDILNEETKEFEQKELQQHVHRTRKYYVHRDPGGIRVYKEITGSGIEFTLRFSAPLGSRRKIVSMITEKILDRFAKEPNVKLAYSTVRVISSPPVS